MYTTKVQLTLSILFLLVAGLLFIPNANAETVHALLVIMDNDPKVGKGMKVNQEKVETLLATVAESYDVDTTIYLRSRAETRKNAVLNWVSDVRPARDDVVFIYYGGHGGMETDNSTFLELTGGRLYRSELATAVEAVSCRLKLLITDACSNGPAPPSASTDSYDVQTVGNKHIRNLFGEHKGFLHITAATEGEFAWCNENFGSLFTNSLVEVIAATSDTNKDRFVSWDEVFELAKSDTQTLFKQAYDAGGFNAVDVQSMKDRGITGQTPKDYSLPQQGSSGNSRNRNSLADNLWELENPRARFDVDIRTDRPRYLIDDTLTLEITAQENCYITVLNWGETGTLTVLLPNEYEPEVFLKKGQRYTFPSASADFDFVLSGPVGVERFKIIAVSTKAAKRPIQDALAQMESQRSKGFISQDIDIKGRSLPKRTATEKKILNALKKLDSSDWSVMNGTIRVRN